MEAKPWLQAGFEARLKGQSGLKGVGGGTSPCHLIRKVKRVRRQLHIVHGG
jgi:hypothetical protein